MRPGSFSKLVNQRTHDNQWRLTRPLFYFHGSGKTVVVKSGFVTDLDSVPRLPGVYAAFKGRAVKSAVVHDWLYETQAGKRYADRMFLDAMKDEGVPAVYRFPIFFAVAFFGGSIYSRKR